MSTIIRNSSIKRVEKEILKESKAEEGVVKQVLKDLSQLEKEVRKAQKSAGNADSTVSKRGQHEHKTNKAMNDAIHDHDLASVKLRAAEKDAKLKHQYHVKLMEELETKKAIIENTIQTQAEHDQAREMKLAQMRGATVALGEPVSPKLSNRRDGLAGQSGPAVDNSGFAAGYGVDHNHTIVDSEGNPEDSQTQRGEVTKTDFPGSFEL